jgi:hypothetical protein
MGVWVVVLTKVWFDGLLEQEARGSEYVLTSLHSFKSIFDLEDVSIGTEDCAQLAT